MNKKILVGSIIAVVTIVLVSSSSEVDIKYDDNEIEPVDNYIEIVSRIDGFVEDYNWQGGIIIQHLHFDARFKGGLNIKALTLNPFKPFYYVEGVKNLDVRRFIGWIFAIDDDWYNVQGYAIGNIVY